MYKLKEGKPVKDYKQQKKDIWICIIKWSIFLYCKEGFAGWKEVGQVSQKEVVALISGTDDETLD